MKSLHRRETNSFSLLDEIRFRITAYLSQLYADDKGLLGNLDLWTQRRIINENLAKLTLILESDDPAEACYRDLIREIDVEAETGIYLVHPDATPRHLCRLLQDPGVSGELQSEIRKIAPVVFVDETSRSTEDLERVWARIQGGHDRAHADATVSEIILSYFLDNAESARDMSNAMRALQYAFHEDVVRRRCELPPLLGEREKRELLIMVSELATRSGSYRERAAEIRGVADKD